MRALAILLGGFLTAAAGGEELRTYESFLHALTDLDRLPLLTRDIVTKQVSSYDRASKYDPTTDTYVAWDAGGDSGKYISVNSKTQEALMLQLNHPGCIDRLWSANPQGKIRFYLDDAKTPLEFDFKELLSGKIAPFTKPFVWQRDNGAGVSYLPIPFAKKIRVTADKPHDQQFVITYNIFPDEMLVEAFHPNLTTGEQKVMEEIAAAWENKGADPTSKSVNAQEVVLDLPAGKEVELTTFHQSGTLVDLFAKLDSPDKNAGRQVVLKVFWDDEETPSIEAPLADFFGGRQPESFYKSLSLGITEKGNYCFWRMPFRKSARFVAINEGDQVAKLRFHASAVLGPVPDNAGYFHAKWRREKACATLDYPLLSVTGRGKFVGAALWVDNVNSGNWFEGDEKAWVDGEKFPSLFGVSTDGFFNQGGNSLKTVDQAWFGAQEAGRATSAYRWLIADSVAFEKSFRFTIENLRWLDGTKNDYASMAYWYAEAGATDLFQPTKAVDRLPLPPRIERDTQEAEKIVAATVPRIADDTLSWGNGVAISGRRGKRVALTVTAPQDDRYRMEMGVGLKTDREAFEILQENRTMGEKVMLMAGKNELLVRLTRDVTSEAPVVLDYVRVTSWRNFGRDWMAIGPFDNPGDEKNDKFDEVYPPEKEIVFDKTYEGKGGDKVGWKLIHAKPNGLVNLREAFPDKPDNAIAYAVTTILSPDPRETDLLLGSDDGVAVWLNGKQVHKNHVHRGAAPDADAVHVKLNAGVNILLVKVDQGGGDWGFYVSLMDTQNLLKFKLPNMAKPAAGK